MTRAINTSIIYYCTKNTLIPSNLSQKMVCSAKALKVAQSTALIRTIMSLLRSSSTRRRFYPLRSSGQAVVTGVVPSPPRYVPSFLFERSEFLIATCEKKKLTVCVDVCVCGCTANLLVLVLGRQIVYGQNTVYLCLSKYIVFENTQL